MLDIKQQAKQALINIFETEPELVTKTMIDVVRSDRVQEIIDSMINDTVNGEGFIDAIVDRINKKQLKLPK